MDSHWRSVPTGEPRPQTRRRVRLTPVPSTAAARVRTYEELDGAEGREVFFRPHRYTAADLAPLSCAVAVFADGAEHECALRDVSQNGVAFAWPASGQVAAHQVLHLAVRFDGHEAFRGEARVSSI